MRLLEQWQSAADPFAIFVLVDTWPRPLRIECVDRLHAWELAPLIVEAIAKAKREQLIPAGRHEARNYLAHWN